MIKARISLMKLPVLSTFCIAALASFAFAQAPATNLPGTPAATGSSVGIGTTTTSADKSKTLTSNDKAFVKKVLDGMFFEMNLTDKHKRDNAKLEGTKEVSGKINTDLNKIWGEVAVLVEPKEQPTALATSDKSKSERIAKAGDKYDKELLEVLEKETKQLEKAFESASKTSQNPTIKQIASTWLPTIRGHGDDIERVSKEATKQK
jgi:predicted outer membrane protein